MISLLTLAEVIFFIVFGVSHFYPFRYSGTICAIAAIAVGILLIVRI